MYMEITLKNNVIVLSVPFVHHTELQTFWSPLVYVTTKASEVLIFQAMAVSLHDLFTRSLQIIAATISLMSAFCKFFTRLLFCKSHLASYVCYCLG